MEGSNVKVEPGGERPVQAEPEEELARLLQRKEVSLKTLTSLAQAGCRTIGIFSSVADSRVQLREFAAKALGLDASAEALEVAALIDAWETAKVISNQRRLLEAEDILAGAMSPTDETLRLCQKQAGAGMLATLPLRQFLSEADTQPQPIQSALDRSGAVRVRKGIGQAEEPKTPEEIEGRLQVMAHSMVMVGMMDPAKGAWQGLEVQDFQPYIRSVCRIAEEASSRETNAASRMLAYDRQVRGALASKVKKGAKFNEALSQAMLETEKLQDVDKPAKSSRSKEEHHNRSRSPQRDRARNKDVKQAPGPGKGTGKSHQSGKGLHTTTPKEQAICLNWNSMKARCRWKCGRAHVCQRCLGPHPLHMCGTGNERRAEAGGASASNHM
eukprot:s2358_g3.t1